MFKKIAGVTMGVLLTASLFTGTAVSAGASPKEGAQEETAAAAAEDYAAYLFVHFVGSEANADEEQIYFSVSKDGTEWNTVNDGKPVLKSNVGEKGVRDPHIIRKQDGTFAIVATDLSIYNRHGQWGDAQTGGSRNIIVWKGNSLTDWSEGAAVEIGVPNALDVWAPEAVYDKEKDAYMVFWASIIGDRESKSTDWVYRIYKSYTEDFTTFTPAEVYMERKESVIDTTFYYDEGEDVYYRFTKAEGNNRNWVFMERGDSINGAFEMVSDFTVNGNHYSQMGGYEGPTLYRINGSEHICLLLDHYGASAGYAPYVTSDISSGTFTGGTSFNFNGVKFRHGSVIPITQAEYDDILKKYPTAALEPEKTTGELIYQLDFEDDVTPAKGTAEATAYNVSYEEGVKGKAVKLEKSKGGYVGIDGSVLAGKDNLTFSFAAKITGEMPGGEQDGGASWLFYAAPNANDQVYESEKYIGASWRNDGRVKAECYNSNRQGRPTQPEYNHNVGFGTWAYITVTYGKKISLYINGELKATAATSVKLSDLLGASPVFYLGRANWPGPELAYTSIDSFRVYDYTMPASEVSALYRADIG